MTTITETAGTIKFFELNLLDSVDVVMTELQKGSSSDLWSGTYADTTPSDDYFFMYGINIPHDSNGSGILDLKFSKPLTLTTLLFVDHNIERFAIDISWGESKEHFLPSLQRPPHDFIGSGNNYIYSDAPITTDALRILMRPPSSGTARFFIKKLYLLNQIGTFEGFPEIAAVRFSNNPTFLKSNVGDVFYNKNRITLENLSLNFKKYNKPDDIDLVRKLHTRYDPFLIWPGGGKGDQFRFNLPGFGFEDIYKVQTKKNVDFRYLKGNYASLIESKISFMEVL